MNYRALIEVVIDGRLPNGSAATDDDIAAAIHLAADHDKDLCELLCEAKFGRRINGDEIRRDEREQALDELEKMRAPTAERPWSPVAVTMAEEMFEDAETGHRDARRALAKSPLRGRALRDKPRARVTADARALLEEAARDLGFEPETLLRSLPRGRLRDVDRARRDALAWAIYRASAAGAKLDAIGKVVGIPKQRVSELAAHGLELDDEAEPAPVS